MLKCMVNLNDLPEKKKEKGAYFLGVGDIMTQSEGMPCNCHG